MRHICPTKVYYYITILAITKFNLFLSEMQEQSSDISYLFLKNTISGSDQPAALRYTKNSQNNSNALNFFLFEVQTFNNRLKPKPFET